MTKVDGSGALLPGEAVAVRTRFDGTWAEGYRIGRADESGYRVCRTSDGHELPVTFDAADVRVVHSTR